MSITLNQHRKNITQLIIASFTDDAPVRSGLSAFFPKVTTIEKEVGIEVERNRQLIAVDVQRGTDPNQNKFSISAEKLFVPPMYNEAWDFTSTARYNVTFGQKTNPSTADAINMLGDANKRISSMRKKIERSIELQRAQALQTGIVQLKNGDNIDYKRKASSMPVLATKWTTVTADAKDDLKTGCNFLREEGLSSGMAVNAIFGSQAFTAFMNLTQTKESSNFRRISRLEISMPQFDNTTGFVFHGQFATEDYVINVWTYNEFYEAANGDKLKYISPKNVILVPEDFEGKTAYAGVPAIVSDMSNAEYPEWITPVETDFYINNYVDKVKKAHWFEIASAPLAIPVSVDRVYTMQVIA